MAVLPMGYVLSQRDRDRKGMFDAIASLGSATRLLDSTSLAAAEATSSGIHDALGKSIDTNEAGAWWATRRFDAAATCWLQEQF